VVVSEKDVKIIKYWIDFFSFFFFIFTVCTDESQRAKVQTKVARLIGLNRVNGIPA